MIQVNGHVTLTPDPVQRNHKACHLSLNQNIKSVLNTWRNKTYKMYFYWWVRFRMQTEENMQIHDTQQRAAGWNLTLPAAVRTHVRCMIHQVSDRGATHTVCFWHSLSLGSVKRQHHHLLMKRDETPLSSSITVFRDISVVCWRSTNG